MAARAKVFPRAKPFLLAALVLALTLPSNAHATLVLNRVVLNGAKKTRLSTILGYLRLRAGKPVDFGVLQEARRRLELTQLFSEVRVWVDLPHERAVQAMYLDPRPQPVDVQVTVKEKFSWFIVPTGSVGAGDRAVGGVYVEQNLFGTGIQVIAAGQYGESTSFGFLGIRQPVLWFAPIAVELSGIYRDEQFRFYESHRRVLEVPTRLAGGMLSLGWVPIPSLRVLIGGLFRREWLRAPHVLEEPGATRSFNATEGNLITVLAILTYDTTTVPEGLLRGVKLTLKNEVSDPVWRSQFGYARVELRVELYGYLFKTYPSVVAQTIIISPTSSGGIPLTEMLRAGGGNLRGYQVGEFLGDTLALLQLEEQFLIFRRFRLPVVHTQLSLAGAVFIDVGALIERHPGGVPSPTTAGFKFEQFHVGVGGGLRLLLPGVAIPAFKLDAAYGIDVRDYALSFSVAGGLL